MARRRSTREKILSLLTRERRIYNRKTREYEHRPIRMAEVARAIGVSPRTLRRWKNEGVEPSKALSQRAAKKLEREAARESRRIASEHARDHKKHPRAVRLKADRLPALPRSHRRKLKRYKFDKKRGRTFATGEEYESTWANYDVHGWRFAEISSLLVQVWKAGRPFQFIYEVPAGGNLPKSGGKPERRVKKKTRVSTAPVNPGAFESEDELLAFLNNYIEYEQTPKGRRLVYVAVDDNAPGRRRR